MSDPRPAASVILARPAGASFELFLVRRAVQSEFASDVYVFPGGTVQPDDRAGSDRTALSAEAAHRRLSERGGRPPATAAESLALHLAAVRELFEEAGVLLARDASDRPLAPDRAQSDRLAAARARLVERRTTLAAVAAAEGLTLAPDLLVYFAHWITPAGFPRRYDTRFFVATMPPGQAALHDTVETTASCWLHPARALQLYHAGRFPLVFAQVNLLDRLAPCQSLADLLQFAATKPVRTVEPLLRPAPAGTFDPYLPEELVGAW